MAKNGLTRVYQNSKFQTGSRLYKLERRETIMKIIVSYSKLITALWKIDVNGNGYFKVSDGENNRKAHFQNNQDGATQAVLEFAQKIYNQTPVSATIANVTDKNKFLGYAFILEY